MKYEKIVQAKFIERENRFVSRVELVPDGEAVRAHVKNTGRCKELLLPGATVYLEDHAGCMGSRKMRYSLIAVIKEVARQGVDGSQVSDGDQAKSILVNMDSQAPNKVVQEALADGTIRLLGFAEPLNADKTGAADRMHDAECMKPSLIRSEVKFGDSRFDFFVESVSDCAGECGDGDRCAKRKRAFIEVKGVTLEEDGHARFPDAPTERGVKHIHELIRAREEGFEAYIIFVVQMEGMKDVSPNYETHPQFGEALAKARDAGVNILAYDCFVTPDSLNVKGPVDVII